MISKDISSFYKKPKARILQTPDGLYIIEIKSGEFAQYTATENYHEENTYFIAKAKTFTTVAEAESYFFRMNPKFWPVVKVIY